MAILGQNVVAGLSLCLSVAPFSTWVAGNLAEYWQLFASHPSLIGGFIWDWVDQSLVAKTSDGMPGGEEVRAQRM